MEGGARASMSGSLSPSDSSTSSSRSPASCVHLHNKLVVAAIPVRRERMARSLELDFRRLVVDAHSDDIGRFALESCSRTRS